MTNEPLSRPAVQRLEAWMKEVTDLLCYQPEIPLIHKQCVAEAMHTFTKEIEALDAKRQKAEARARKEPK